MNDNIQELIEENSHLFWWVPQEKKKDLSLDSLVVFDIIFLYNEKL